MNAQALNLTNKDFHKIGNDYAIEEIKKQIEEYQREQQNIMKHISEFQSKIVKKR